MRSERVIGTCLGIAALVAYLGWAGASAAQPARRVVGMLGGARALELSEAIRLELAARGVSLVVVAPPPDGSAGLARAAHAQETARALGAEAAVWLEEAPIGGGAAVRVVGAAADGVQHAPLPAPLATVEARVVALVAASLLDEAGAAAEEGAPPVTVRVAVDVEAPGRRVEVVPLAPPAAALAAPAPDRARTPRAPVGPAPVVAAAGSPGSAADVAPPGSDTPQMSREGWNLQAEAFFAGVAGGLGVTLAHWLDDAWRLGPSARLSLVWADDFVPAMALGATLMRAGRARSGRFDFGVHAGLVVVYDDGSNGAAAPGGAVEGRTYVSGALYGWTAEGLFGWGWELSPSLAIDLRFALGAAQVGGDDLVPVAWAAFGVELPL